MENSGKLSERNNYRFTYLLTFSIFCLIATFVISISDLKLSYKIFAFSLILLSFFISAAVLYFSKMQNILPDSQEKQDMLVFNPQINDKLLILEEASSLFASSSKSSNMFRLVANRINEIIPFSCCVLFIYEKNNYFLNAEFVEGQNKDLIKNTRISITEGIAGQALIEEKAVLYKKLLADKSVFSPESLEGFTNAVAVPLSYNSKIFGVLEIFGTDEIIFDERTVLLIKNISAQVAPLLANSIITGRSAADRSNDLFETLPRERTFHWLLENQIAETYRFFEKKNLTVLVIEIQGISDLQEKLDASVFESLIDFSAKIIKSQLREIDFLARSLDDEFLAVLPTATEPITKNIIKRIEREFISQPFFINHFEKIDLRLNCGFALFPDDAEKAAQLLQIASLRKVNGISDNNNVVQFSKEFPS